MPLPVVWFAPVLALKRTVDADWTRGEHGTNGTLWERSEAKSAAGVEW